MASGLMRIALKSLPVPDSLPWWLADSRRDFLGRLFKPVSESATDKSVLDTYHKNLQLDRQLDRKEESLLGAMGALHEGEVSPMRRLRLHYGPNTEEQISAALDTMANRPQGSFLMNFPKWDRSELMRRYPVSEIPPESRRPGLLGSYDPVARSIEVLPNIHTLPRTLDHEMTHAYLQAPLTYPTPHGTSLTRLFTRDPVGDIIGKGDPSGLSRKELDDMFARASDLDYIGLPHEIDPRLAAIKRSHANLTQRPVTTLQDAADALNLHEPFMAERLVETGFLNEPYAREIMKRRMLELVGLGGVGAGLGGLMASQQSQS